MKTVHPLAFVPAAVAAGLLATPAHAYIGPGVGLGVIGTVFGIVATLALAVFGFLWYPMKRLMAKRRGKAAQAASAAGSSAPTGAPTGATTGATRDATPPALATGGTADVAGAGPATGPDALAPTSVRPSVDGADVRRPHAEEA